MAFIARTVSGGTVPLYMIPVMIFLPVIIGAVVGFAVGKILQKNLGKISTLAVLLVGITITSAIGLILNKTVFTNIALNYMLMGVSLVFTGIISSVLATSEPKLATIVTGTIAAAAGINEIIAVFASKKGFELAGEIKEK